jgi:hypothetical protein
MIFGGSVFDRWIAACFALGKPIEERRWLCCHEPNQLWLIRSKLTKFSKGDNTMSAESVEQVIGKAVVDGEYRELLFSEPDKALEGYELTEEESTALKGIEREKLDAVVTVIEDRISRAGLSFSGAAIRADSQSMNIFKDATKSLGTIG